MSAIDPVQKSAGVVTLPDGEKQSAPEAAEMSSLGNASEAGSSSDRAGYEIADFAAISGVPCPCGTARRAFADVADFPGTIHLTTISANAKRHYHKRLTETYVFLECGAGAAMELDGDRIPVHEGMSILIRPGTRHRAIGEMQVLIVCLPKFDADDEWFD